MIIHDCEQGTPEWNALRLGLPTASMFSKLLTTKGEPSKSANEYAISLAGEVYANKPELDAWGGNSYTERGKELEDQAIALYEFDRDVTVERVGFVTDDVGDAGCSPDGLVNDDGMVEVKCLKAENHIKAILFHKKNGRCPSTYVLQTQGQLMICERQWSDLIFFHPDLPLLVIRQLPDGNLQSALTGQIQAVRKERDAVLATLHETQNQVAATPETPAPVIPVDPETVSPFI